MFLNCYDIWKENTNSIRNQFYSLFKIQSQKIRSFAFFLINAYSKNEGFRVFAKKKTFEIKDNICFILLHIITLQLSNINEPHIDFHKTDNSVLNFTGFIFLTSQISSKLLHFIIKVQIICQTCLDATEPPKMKYVPWKTAEHDW